MLGDTTYQYDGVTPRVLSTSHSEGFSTTYSYQQREQDYRFQQILHSHSTAGDISSFSYEYSPAGRILAWNRKIAPNVAEDRYEFGYDSVDQLTSATLTESATSAIKATYAYGYDGAGNRTSTRENNVLRQNTFNTANQQLSGQAGGETKVEGKVNQATSSITVGGKPAIVSSTGRFFSSVTLEPGINRIPLIITQTDGTVTQKTMEIQIEDGRQLAYIYDLNGNLEKVTPSEDLNSPLREYSWDAADRLLSITRHEADQVYSSVFGYNSASQRVEIQEYAGPAGSLELQSHHRYIWSGHRPTQKRDATGAITLSTYTGDGQLDSPEAGGSGRKLYFARDHLGSIRNVHDAAGTEIASYDYSPYGKRTLVSGTEEIEFGYTGHHYHPASQTVLTLYRGYDPNTGRWLSPDPLGEGVNAMGNLYSYGPNNPMNGYDPDGRAWFVPLVLLADRLRGAYYGAQTGSLSGGVSAGVTSCGDPKAIATGSIVGGITGAVAGFVSPPGPPGAKKLGSSFFGGAAGGSFGGAAGSLVTGGDFIDVVSAFTGGGVTGGLIGVVDGVTQGGTPSLSLDVVIVANAGAIGGLVEFGVETWLRNLFDEDTGLCEPSNHSNLP